MSKAVILAGILLVPSALLAEVSSMPYERAVVPGSGSGAVAAFAFDEDIFRVADAAYVNVRILDAEGGEAPFLVRTRKHTATITSLSQLACDTVSLVKGPDNSMDILVRQRGKGVPRYLVLENSLQNFEKQVTVESSADGELWRVLAERTPIYDYTRFIALRSDRVALAPGVGEHLRIRVFNVAETDPSPLFTLAKESRGGAVVSQVEQQEFRRTDFKVDHVRLLEEVTSTVPGSPVFRSYPCSTPRIFVDSKERCTRVEFDAARVPLRRLTLKTTDVNFSRLATTEGYEDPVTGTVAPNGGWKVLAQRVINRVEFAGHRSECLVIDLPGTCRYSRYRVTIRNLDSPPLKVTGVEADGEVHEAVFLPRSGGTYRVLYGGEGIRPPQYDIGDVLGSPETLGTVDCTLGSPHPNPLFRSHRRWSSLGGKTILGGAIVLMVGGLGWVIWRMSMRPEFL